jgi:hypothetical protein
VSEIVFPILGAAFVLFCVLPLCALIAKVLVVVLETDALGGPLRHVNLKYAVLTGSSLLPIAWFVSAGVHQAESGNTGLACLFAHDDPAACFESALFAFLLVATVGFVWFRTRRLYGLVQSSSLARAHVQTERIARLLTTHRELADLRGRVHLTDGDEFTIVTRGLFRRGVFVGVTFAESLSDQGLCGALGHEQQHVGSFDPLRYWLLEVAMGLNPCGRFLLAPHVSRWNFAREAQCDRTAVVEGASPLALADAILLAARPHSRQAVALSTDDTAVLRLRVGLLLAFSEIAPVLYRDSMRLVVPVPLALVVLALLLPHQTSTHALDAVHAGTEQAVGLFLNE